MKSSIKKILLYTVSIIAGIIIYLVTTFSGEDIGRAEFRSNKVKSSIKILQLSLEDNSLYIDKKIYKTIKEEAPDLIIVKDYRSSKDGKVPQSSLITKLSNEFSVYLVSNEGLMDEEHIENLRASGINLLDLSKQSFKAKGTVVNLYAPKNKYETLDEDVINILVSFEVNYPALEIIKFDAALFDQDNMENKKGGEQPHKIGLYQKGKRYMYFSGKDTEKEGVSALLKNSHLDVITIKPVV